LRRFVLGLVVGVIVGGGGVYVGLRRPWEHPPEVTVELEPDAGPRAEAPARRRRGKPKVADRGRSLADPGEAPAPELSDRDRQLAWRGPAVELPPRTVSFTGGQERRPLSPDEINDGVRTNADAVSTCIKEARGAAPLASTVTVEFLVDERGRATTVRTHAATYLLQRGLLPCAQRAVRGMRFRATGAATVVKVPFTLRDGT
jgi:hypothetical protein